MPVRDFFTLHFLDCQKSRTLNLMAVARNTMTGSPVALRIHGIVVIVQTVLTKVTDLK